MNTTAGGPCFEPPSSSLFYSQAALSGLGGSHGSLQEPVHVRSNMLYSNCSGGLPNIILTGKHALLWVWAGHRGQQRHRSDLWSSETSLCVCCSHIWFLGERNS